LFKLKIIYDHKYYGIKYNSTCKNKYKYIYNYKYNWYAFIGCRFMTRFFWDVSKEIENVIKHDVDFKTAMLAFQDPERRILFDSKHSSEEERFFCIGKVENKVLTVRFTYRNHTTRIIGAGCWRKGRKIYEKKSI